MASTNTTWLVPGRGWGNDMNNSTGLYNMSLLGNASMAAGAGGVPIETEGCRLFRFILYTVVCGILCALGFLGNSLSFLVLQRDRSAPVASFLLQVMAIADNLFLLLWFIHYSIKDVFRYFESDARRNPVWLYIRVYTFPFLYMTQMLTIWLTVVVALNRYMAVCLPYRAPALCTIHNVYKEVIVVTIFSILYNVPRFLELTVTSTENTTSWDRSSIGNDPIYQTLYIDAMYYVFTFVLPLLLLAFVNTRVIIAYRATQVRRRRMTTRRAENENNITLVMIMVVAIFMLCQAPARIVQLVWGYSFNHCEEYQYYLIHISNFLEVLNSSVNFLIYFTFRKRFRDILGEYYCTYGPLYLRPEARKSLTTEALALSEYQPTGPSGGSGSAGSSIRDSLKKILTRGGGGSGKLEGNTDTRTVFTTDKTTQVKARSNGDITDAGVLLADDEDEDRGTAAAGGIQSVSRVECHERNHNTETAARGGTADLRGGGDRNGIENSSAPTLSSSKANRDGDNTNRTHQSRSSLEERQAAELIEYELSCENPVSHASSPDDGVTLTDGEMLIATV